jgi:hypothetical protein
MFLSSLAVSDNRIDLSGPWRLRLDPGNTGIKNQWFNEPLDDQVQLPGTLDTNQKGTPTAVEPELKIENLKHLTRKYEYTGPAWYQRQIHIPKDWEDQQVFLTLERIIWESTVWIDDQQIDSRDSLVTPHIYDFSEYASPGEHTLTIRIDNSYKYNIGSHPNFDHPIGHAYTDETQTVWNGIIGEIALHAVDKVYIKDIQVYPDLAKGDAGLKISIANETGQPVKGKLKIQSESSNTDQKHRPDPLSLDFDFSGTEHLVTADYSMGQGFLRWDEFTPALYNLHVECAAKSSEAEFQDSKNVRFGMREFKADKTLLKVNGRRVYLRGTLECCIFPLTGHPPADMEGWARIYNIARSYGLNHLRFHSWCPPEAAFAAADEAGFYLQVELPVWVPNAGQDPPRDEFLRQEGYRMLKAYGNHPSFCLMSMGNEMAGDYAFLHDLVTDFKDRDPRHLYTSTTFSFQDDHGKWPEEVDDFFISQQTLKGWVRGQGFVNQQRPSTDFDYSKSMEGLPVPLITHEIGQTTVYPNLEEIEKYMGVLKPLNFMSIKKDLKEKGLLSQANIFTQATGKFGVELYKTELELAFRTPGTNGFQMLDLHDFPGQGTALIGILDAFWDSKGLIEPKAFRRFCSETVLLARLPKRVYTNNESFDATIEIAHFGPEPITQANLVWTVKDQKGQTIGQGNFEDKEISIGNGIALGTIHLDLNSVKFASKLNLEVQLKDTHVSNDWDFWVYPSDLPMDRPDDIVVTESIDEKLIQSIEGGHKILLLPKGSLFKDKIPGRFVPVFWSPVHFSNQPGTMGILCEPSHPALAQFPTESYSDWQWWDLNINSVVFKLDPLPGDIEPIVQIIDNFSRNHKLATIIEFRIGKAKIIVSSMDLTTDLDQRPEARQLRYSLLQYMDSNDFSPKATVEMEDLRGLLKEATAMTNARILNVSSAQSGYPAENIIDNDPATIWHTAWSPEIIKHPHEVVIDLNKEYQMRGFTYLPRQDNTPNGWIKDYAFYVSQDGKQWGDPVAKGTFEQNDLLKKVSFYDDQSIYSEEKIKGRYIRLMTLSGFGDDPYTTIAELDIITD